MCHSGSKLIIVVQTMLMFYVECRHEDLERAEIDKLLECKTPRQATIIKGPNVNALHVKSTHKKG